MMKAVIEINGDRVFIDDMEIRFGSETKAKEFLLDLIAKGLYA